VVGGGGGGELGVVGSGVGVGVLLAGGGGALVVVASAAFAVLSPSAPKRGRPSTTPGISLTTLGRFRPPTTLSSSPPTPSCRLSGCCGFGTYAAWAATAEHATRSSPATLCGYMMGGCDVVWCCGVQMGRLGKWLSAKRGG